MNNKSSDSLQHVTFSGLDKYCIPQYEEPQGPRKSKPLQNEVKQENCETIYGSPNCKSRPYIRLYCMIKHHNISNPPAPEVQGAWSSGWHKSTKVQVYLGGGAFIWKKPPVFDRSWRSPSQNTVKNSTEWTCSLPRPPNLGQKKVKKPRVFQFFGFIFWVCNVFFFCRWCGVARTRFFVILDPFLD